MNELDRAQDIGMHGLEADRAVKALGAEVLRWKVALPKVTPLVLDFGLGKFARTGLIECWIANEAEAGYCGKYMFLSDGQECPLHFHRQKHETFFVVCGRFSVQLDGKRRMLSAGQSLAIPTGHMHSFRGAGPALMLELSMPCQVHDNYFENPKIMAWLGKPPIQSRRAKPSKATA